VLELWQAKNADPEFYREIQILEVANPLIKLSITPDLKASIVVCAVADAQTFQMGSARPKQLKYLVSDATVVPLREERFETVFNELENISGSIDGAQPELVASLVLKISSKIGVRIKFEDEFTDFLENLPAEKIESAMSLPLWDYQNEGLSWMYRLWQSSLGGILGDEMGVGKTLQLLALACRVSDESTGAPSLVVVPGNLLLKWCADFIKFAEKYLPNVHVHYGNDRSRNLGFLRDKKIILTTYSMLVEDEHLLSQIYFSVVCCDEAHEVKEWRTLKSRALRALNSKAKFLATGTPIQNKLLDYWTLLDIVEPGLLGSREWFEAKGRDTPNDAKHLMEQTKHRILRRTQEEVNLQIPEGIETLVPLELDYQLWLDYKEIERGESPFAFGKTGLASVPARRQYCAHPSTFLEESMPNLGSKATYLLNELDSILARDEKAVVFVADFNRPLDLYLELIQNEFDSLWTGTIDGRVPLDLRFYTLEEFNKQPGSAVLLVNPQVGGQGLDMVAANHVFHMNPAWNPAKTDQATFRVTRPGQSKKTFSHFLYYVGTLEEQIQDLVSSKREISEAALEVAEANAKNQIHNFISLFDKKYRGEIADE
jgi:SNF2 family DNA or RNA helicase